MTLWAAVVPIKPWRSAKSRLEIPANEREALARALALDTLDVLTSHDTVANVVVVTADPDVAWEARLRGASVLAERTGGDPLNDAIRQGLAFVTEHLGDGPTVVVPADLAYLSSAVLSSALDALAGRGKVYVADRDSTGTTLLTAGSASEIDPHYGIGSAALHSEAGFRRLDQIDPRARADIDQVSDLVEDWTPGPRVASLLGADVSVPEPRPAPSAMPARGRVVRP